MRTKLIQVVAGLLLFLAPFVTSAAVYNQGAVYFADSEVVNHGAAGIGSVKSVIDAIGVTKLATIVLTSSSAKTNTTYTFNTSLSVPRNITLKIEPGAQAVVATSKTLTISGPFDAGLYQVFNCIGTGKVLFDGGTVVRAYPQWWGALGDDSHDDLATISAAVASGVRKVFLSRGIYKTTGTLLISTSSMDLEGESPTTSILKAYFSGSVIELNKGLIETYGSIASGSSSLKVVSVTNIAVGKELLIRGAGKAGALLRATVKAVAGTTVTLNTSASTTVEYAPVRLHYSDGNLIGNCIRNLAIKDDGKHTANGIEIFATQQGTFENLNLGELGGEGIIFRSFNDYAASSDEHFSHDLIFRNIFIEGRASGNRLKNGIVTRGACLALAASKFENIYIRNVSVSGIGLSGAMRLGFENITIGTTGSAHKLSGGVHIRHSGRMTPREITIQTMHNDTSLPRGVVIESGQNIRLIQDDYVYYAGSDSRGLGKGYLGLSPNNFGVAVNTTGAITKGSNALSVATATNMYVGQIITVTGAGFNAEQLITTIKDISGTNVTIENIASKTVAAGAVKSLTATITNISSEQTYFQLPASAKSFSVFEADSSVGPGYINGWSIRDYYASRQDYTVTAASNDTPVQITTSQAHGLANGDYVTISGVKGNYGANGRFAVTVVDATKIKLNSSIGTARYVSGGTLKREFLKKDSGSFNVSLSQKTRSQGVAAWAMMGDMDAKDGTTPSLVKSFNIAAIIRIGAGQYKFIFEQPLNSPGVTVATGRLDKFNIPITPVVWDSNTTYSTIRTYNVDKTLVDTPYLYVIVIDGGL